MHKVRVHTRPTWEQQPKVFSRKCYVIYKIDTPGRGEGEDFQKWSSLLGGRGEVVVSNVVLEKTMWCVVCVSR